MQSQDQERHDVQEQPATTSTTLAVVNARFERDTSGFNRHVYRLSDGSEVFFRGREETVDLDEALNRESIAVGSSSHWLQSPRESVSGEELREGRKDSDVSAPILMSVSKTLTGVLEVARYRSPENKEIQELLTQCKQGIYSERAHILLEELLACNLFGKDGFSGDEPHAEMLVIDALLGDTESKRAVEMRVTALREFIAHNKQSEEQYLPEVLEGEKSLAISELMCVHATHFRPETREDGTVLIPSAASASDYKSARSSVHVALNHRVSSHVFGQWNDCPYVVVAPLEGVIAESGNPYMLNTVDTWWVLNPGQPLVLPDAHIIALNSEGQEKLFDDSEPQITKVKSPPYVQGDVEELLDELYEHDEVRRLLHVQLFLKDLKEVREGTGEGAPEDTLTQKESELLEGVLFDVATARIISRAGLTPRDGGMWAWDGNSWDATRETTQLAARMGVFSGNHTDTPPARGEGLLGRAIGKAAGGWDENPLVDDSGKIPTPIITEERLKDIPLVTLLCAYESGVFFGRCARGDNKAQ